MATGLSLLGGGFSLVSTGATGAAGATGSTGSTGPTGPVNTIASKATSYTTVIGDANTTLLHPSASTTGATFTIDSNANVGYALGTLLTFVNEHGAGSLGIAITADSMYLAGTTGTTGTRTLTASGIAQAMKVATTEWIISGTGLT